MLVFVMFIVAVVIVVVMLVVAIIIVVVMIVVSVVIVIIFFHQPQRAVYVNDAQFAAVPVK